MAAKPFEFWCYLPIELKDVFNRFRSAFPATEYVHDAENVWEWFDGKTSDSLLGFNITRQWEDDVIPDQPVRISLLIDESLVLDDVGQRLAAAMKTDVHTGIVEYVRGDDFEFITCRVFKPQK